MLPWEAARTAQRKRAALLLAGLAILALLVVGGMLLLLNKSSGDDKPAAIPPPGPTQASSAPSSSSAPRTSSPAPTTSKLSPKAPTSTSTVLTCRVKPACALPGDPGSAVAAVNAYRTSHGRTAVPGSVTRAAQKCAVANGDRSACPQTYFWEPVSGHRGADVVDKIAAKGDGPGFLLDRKVKSISVGWAYLPSTGGYECAIVNGY